MSTASTPEQPNDLRVAYRRAADIFEIMDGVAMSQRAGADRQYRKAWEAAFGSSAADQKWLDAYVAIRAPHGRRRLDRGGLFAPRQAPDRFAAAFHASDTLASALDRLRSELTPAEIATLGRFYAHFETRYALWLEQSRAFEELVPRLQRRLDEAGAASFRRHVAEMYGAHDIEPMTILYVWWPQGAHTTAKLRGNVLLLQYHPVAHRADAEGAEGVVVHELVHDISARQPSSQKLTHSERYLANCPLNREALEKPAAIEEPLAVAFQRVFESRQRPVEFDTPWYGGHPWVGSMAKAIYPSVLVAFDKRQAVDDALISVFAEACTRLTAEGSP